MRKGRRRRKGGRGWHRCLAGSSSQVFLYSISISHSLSVSAHQKEMEQGGGVLVLALKPATSSSPLSFLSSLSISPLPHAQLPLYFSSPLTLNSLSISSLTLSPLFLSPLPHAQLSLFLSLFFPFSLQKPNSPSLCYSLPHSQLFLSLPVTKTLPPLSLSTSNQNPHLSFSLYQ